MDITIHASFLPHDDPDASLAFYRDTLGFAVSPVGPPGDPVFAMMQRDGVELMLQKAGEPVHRPVRSELRMDAYIRVSDVRAFRESVMAKMPGVEPIVAASPMPLAPSGLRGLSVCVFDVSKLHSSAADGIE